MFGDRLLDGAPGRGRGRRPAGVGGDGEPGVVVDHVDHPRLAAVGQLHLGRVVLPQVVGHRPLEPPPRQPSAARLHPDRPLRTRI
jgi:hypothetical protein